MQLPLFEVFNPMILSTTFIPKSYHRILENPVKSKYYNLFSINGRQVLHDIPNPFDKTMK